MNERKLKRDEYGRPFTICPKCNFRISGFNQTPQACPGCLRQWLESQGVPIMRYAEEGGTK